MLKMSQSKFVDMRTIQVIIIATSVLIFVTAVAALWMARHFYFRAKLTAALPVALDLYAEENIKIVKGDTTQIRVKPRVVMIGDSRVRAMRLAELKKSWEVVNRGVNGETSAQMLMRFKYDALALKPDVIVIQSGINDLVAGIASYELAPILTAKTVDNLKKMAMDGAAANAKVVILTVIPPAKPSLLRRFAWSENVRNEVASVNASLLEWKPPDGIKILDLREVFRSGLILPSEYASDTLHLNQNGYVILEEKIVSFLSMSDD